MTQTTPEADPAPAIEDPRLAASVTDLPPLRRVLVTKPIPREIGVDLAPGQRAWLPAAQAEAEIAAGRAEDPDAKDAAKSKAKT